MAATRLEHPALTAGGEAIEPSRASGVRRIALMMQAAALLAHLEWVGWRLRDGWVGARIDRSGRLRGLTAERGESPRWPHRQLHDLLSSLFPHPGRGPAWRAARSMLRLWGQAAVRIPPDLALGDLLSEAPFLWSPSHADARSALVAEVVRGGERQARVAGPARWRRQCLDEAPSAASLELSDWVSGDRAGRCWARATRRSPTGRGLQPTALVPDGVGSYRLAAVERALRGRPEPAARLMRARCLRELEREGALRVCLRHLRQLPLTDEQQRERERLLRRADDLPPSLPGRRRRLDPWQAARRWRALGRTRRAAADLSGAERAFRHAERLWRRCDAPGPRRRALLDLVEVRLARGAVQGAAKSLAGEALTAGDGPGWERRLRRARLRCRSIEADGDAIVAGGAVRGRRAERAWQRVHEYLTDRRPSIERLRALFAGAGYPEARLEWRRESDRSCWIEGPGGDEEISAEVHRGRLVLRAERLDPILRTLFVIALRDFHALRSTLAPGVAMHQHGGSGGRPGGVEIVGESEALRAVLARLDRLAPARLPVLIRGASGTGKELAARRVHGASPRRSRPFVAVNCAALPRGLVASDLFGHARGAFTGADRERIGVFEVARGGTVLLDEIGDLDPGAQGMLLRVLQESEIRRLGESRTRAVDVRIVAATHRDLTAMVDSGDFRRDLYYRLAAGSVALPPLARRGDDVLLLLEHFLAVQDRTAGRSPDRRSLTDRISPGALDRLLSHPWPGNVRELQNVVAVATALAGDRRIETADLELRRPQGASLGRRPEADAGGASYHARLEELRRRLVEEALSASGGNRSRAARRLGLSRQAMSYLVRRLGISSEAPRGVVGQAE